MWKTIDRSLYLMLLVLLVTTNALAQTRILRGHVVDTDNQPMVGVYVMVKDAQTGVVTDSDGQFEIKVQPKSTLVFSFIGYKTKELVVNSSKRLIVKMTRDAQMMQEVVIVGYGQQKKESVVGAISQTKGESLLKTGGLNSISEALQGQMPGITAINTNSKPGEDVASLLIRGKASWNSTSPLYLVDGVERDFNDIDVNEIASVSVLKDASATAVYGVKGANGVILITTKRGSDQAPKINFSANVGFKRPTVEYNWLDYNESQQLYNEAAANDKLWDKLIPESTITAWNQAFATGNYGPYNDYFPNVDWYKTMTKNYGVSKTYNINVRGGTKKVSYFVSLGYVNDGDIYDLQKNDEFDPSYYYKRYNWRSNLDFKLTKSTKLSVNIAGKIGNINNPTYSGTQRDNMLATSYSNLFPIKYSDGTYGADPLGGNNAYAFMNLFGQSQKKTFQGFYDVIFDQKLNFITKGLSFNAKLSYTSNSSRVSSIVKSKIYGTIDTRAATTYVIRAYREYDYSQPMVAEDGTISYPMISETLNPENLEEDLPVGVMSDHYSSYGRKLYYQAALNYKRSFKDHNVTALALFNRQEIDASSGKNMEFTQYSEDWVGRVTYNYKSKYLAEVNAAYTGSEKFAPGKRFGFFPSYSVGWRVTQEPWFKSLVKGWMNNLKIRYSYGEVGSDRGAPRFNYITQFASSGSVSFGKDQPVTYSPLYKESRLGYRDATWETAIKQNLGIEMRLIDHLSLTLDLFSEKRNDILMSRRTIAPWMGISLPSVNIGKTKNHGLELMIKWDDQISNDLFYHLQYGFSTSENRIVFKDDPNKLPDYLKQAGKPIGYQTQYLATGNFGSLDDIYNTPHTAISKTNENTLIPGDLSYIDFNGDGIINGLDKVIVDHVSYPLTTMNFSMGFDYKGFSFSAMFYAALDVWQNDLGTFTWDFPSGIIKCQPNAYERWTTADANATSLVRPSLHLTNIYNELASTYTFKNYSFLRLKNVEISYSLPKHWIKHAALAKAQIYANGSNLWTLTNVDDRRDPETGNDKSYPIVKRYNIGVRLTF